MGYETHHRKFGLAASVISLLVVFLGYFVANLALVFHESTVTTDASAPAAIVMGAAQFNGVPSNVFRARLIHAEQLFVERRIQRIVVVGGSILGDKYSEAGVGRAFLIQSGVPARSVIAVPSGDDSFESIAAAARSLTLRGIRSVIMVSDSFHSYRIVQIADGLGLMAQASPSTTSPIVGMLKFEYMLREALAVSAGRIFGYRMLSEIRHGEPSIPLW